jgi:hypothetical protein
MCIHRSCVTVWSLTALGLASLATAASGCLETAAGLPSEKDATMAVIQPPDLDPVEYDPPVVPMPGPHDGLFIWQFIDGGSPAGDILEGEVSDQGAEIVNPTPGE